MVGSQQLQPDNEDVDPLDKQVNASDAAAQGRNVDPKVLANAAALG